MFYLGVVYVDGVIVVFVWVEGEYCVFMGGVVVEEVDFYLCGVWGVLGFCCVDEGCAWVVGLCDYLDCVGVGVVGWDCVIG